MKIIRVLFFTFLAAFFGFVVGYIFFARYADDFIPLKSIFMGSIADEGVLNHILNLKLKILVTVGSFAFTGLSVIVFVEYGGRRTTKNKIGFYECKYCGFKSTEKTPFCIACECDENGLTKYDYKERAAEKLRNKN